MSCVPLILGNNGDATSANVFRIVTRCAKCQFLKTMTHRIDGVLSKFQEDQWVGWGENKTQALLSPIWCDNYSELQVFLISYRTVEGLCLYGVCLSLLIDWALTSDLWIVRSLIAH